MADAPGKPGAPRRARVAAPGAPRIVLTGQMAVPDAYGRVRVLLLDQRQGGDPDHSWQALRAALPGGAGRAIPYALHPEPSDGVRGEFWAVPPAHRKQHWLQVAGELRGREVRVEATIREYAFARRQVGGAPAHARGAALDVATIEPL